MISSIRTKGLSSLMFAILALAAAIMTMGKTKPEQSFAFDFPKYIGGSLEAMIKDIGYPPESHEAKCIVTGGHIYYMGYQLNYSSAVEVHAYFDSIICRTDDEEIHHDIDYFKDITIKKLKILYICH